MRNWRVYVGVVLLLSGVVRVREEWRWMHPPLPPSPTKKLAEENGWERENWWERDKRMEVPDAPIDLGFTCVKRKCGELGEERKW